MRSFRHRDDPKSVEKLIILKPESTRSASEWTRRQCKITRTDGNRIVSEDTLWYEFSAGPRNPTVEIAPPDDAEADSYLLAMLFDAMQEGRRIVVQGTVCKTLLSNLVELQAAWHKWVPGYRSQPIEVEDARCPASTTGPSTPGRDTNAICAFSGGVDATFSVWRHHRGSASWRSQSIGACAIVHGFDIPLADQGSFDRALLRSQRTLDELAIPLIAIRTNYRQLSRVDWQHAFASALVAALGNLKSVASTCLIGSSEPYDSLVVPLGSSPITDHLLGSRDFQVIHDGASHSRTEKVAEISQWTTGANNLRVCWEGELRDRNCGRCEKCVRTMLNFLVCRQEIPACFPDDVDLIDSLKRIRLKNDAVRAEWKQVLDRAKSAGIDARWVQAAKQTLTRRQRLIRWSSSKPLRTRVSGYAERLFRRRA